MITNPMLPPKRGYVEVEIGGVRTYRNVKTGILIENEPDLQIDALTQTQLALAELAQVVEDNNTANQLALAELAELMTGEV